MLSTFLKAVLHLLVQNTEKQLMCFMGKLCCSWHFIPLNASPCCRTTTSISFHTQSCNLNLNFLQCNLHIDARDWGHLSAEARCCLSTLAENPKRTESLFPMSSSLRILQTGLQHHIPFIKARKAALIFISFIDYFSHSFCCMMWKEQRYTPQPEQNTLSLYSPSFQRPLSLNKARKAQYMRKGFCWVAHIRANRS